MRRIPIILLTILLIAPAQAQDFKKGYKAAQQGDYATALREWRPLAAQGFASAQYNLAIMYDKGDGVAQDFAVAAKWYGEAADQGHVEAQYNLANMYRKGDGVTQDHVASVKWYLAAAQQGHAGAQNELGHAYQNSRGVPQDYAEAVKWFRQAAENGVREAQYNIGIAFDLGQGVPQDYAEAAKWYQKAAAQGLPQAQSNLGVMFLAGEGVPQDYVQAEKWLKQAAAQGVKEAQYNVGVQYALGKGPEQNLVVALMWFHLAAALGDENAPVYRAEIVDELTDIEISLAGRLAHVWQKHHPQLGWLEQIPFPDSINFDAVEMHPNTREILPKVIENATAEGLKRSADATNARAPFAVDELTILTGQEAIGLTLISNFKLLVRRKDVSSQMLDTFEMELKRRRCLLSESHEGFSGGLVSRFHYVDVDGIPLMEVEFSEKTCANVSG